MYFLEIFYGWVIQPQIALHGYIYKIKEVYENIYEISSYS